MTDALLRQWTLLRLIPRAPRKADVSQLLALLADAGHAITRRQLQRDLNTLSRLFPISADERGVAHGWSWLREAPAFDLPRMDGATALSVKLLEQFIPQLLPPTLNDHLQPYFRQADKVLAEHAAPSLGHWLDRVRVVPREMPLLAPEVDTTVARTVYQSLLDGKRFTADYASRSAPSPEPREYVVSPLGLVARGNLLYLVCTLWDYTDLRQLAMHRIRTATATDVPVTTPAGFDLDQYIAKGEFHYPLGPEIRLEARFYRGAATHLYETPLSADQTITDLDADHVLVTATVRDTEQLHWWLLGFGSMVTVVSPDSLRVEMAQDLANAARAYVAPVPTPSNQGDFT
jgi:predicted DNA-binding transcriptional regulator YafY